MCLIGGEMIKKFFMPVAFFTLIFFMTSCGGSGGGSSSTSRGVNAGIPSVVKMTDVQHIVQTNSFAFFKARILDGNGTPVPNELVTFTNLSPIGTLNAVNATTVAYTDDLGFATATVKSNEEGFVTVQAEVNSGAGQVRDRRTVFFTSGSLALFPFMILDVDSDGDGSFNEPDDFILLQDETDNEVLVRATVFDQFGFRVGGTGVLFGADAPYRVGTDDTAPCSDGSADCEVVFPSGVQKFTNSLGEAFVLVRFEANSIRSIQTLFNVLAQADNGAFNLVTLFVEPVFIDRVILSADPSIVDTGGSSTISADVITNLNTPPPDETTVNFRTTCGSVEPFGQTTDGRAEVDFTAPSTEGTCTITGSVAGVSGFVSVRVTTELTINPSTVGVDGSTGAVLPFTISGGIGPYTTTSSDPINAFNDNGAGGGTAGDGIKNGTEGGVWTGSSINVTVPVGASGSVTLNVQDSDGNTVSATITITAAAALSVVPAAATAGCGGVPVPFTVSGGVIGTGYTVVSLNPTAALITSPPGGIVTADPGMFTATTQICIPPLPAPPLPPSTPVSITVTDNNTPPAVVTVTLTVTNP
jgi:hypothetical protein